MMKRCPKCNLQKSLEEFYRRSNGGPTSWCKLCTRQRDKERVSTPEGREKLRERQRIWAKRNPEKVKARRKRQRLRDRKAIIDAYGKMCECCGEDEPMFLTIDHIDGREPDHPDRTNLYRYLIREGFPKGNYRLLCYNCNCGRQINGGTCPHHGLTAP